MLKLEGNKLIVTLDGREESFTETELIGILRDYVGQETDKISEKPIEGEWFDVNPTEIDQSLFYEERRDTRQEGTRIIILEALAELNDNPSKYGRPFQVMNPENTWYPQRKLIQELEEMAFDIGDHMENWVEKGLEWAQRIANGESWKSVCNDPDTARWYRLINWKNGSIRIIGGATRKHSNASATSIRYYDYKNVRKNNSMVPSVVRYK